MKTPPGHREIPVRAVAVVEGGEPEHDRRFLVFVGVALVSIALGFKSELLAQNQVWALGLGLIVVAAPAILAYLRAEELPAIEHYIPVALGAITLAGLTDPVFGLETWKFAFLTAMFGIGFVIVARLDYLRLRSAEKRGHVVLQEAILITELGGAYLVVVTLPFNPLLKLAWILTITFLASYRSFRINGSSITPSRAFLFALFVAQVVTFLAWVMVALDNFLILNEGAKAVILLLAWYINRGLVRHTVEETFTRHVVLEYVAFAAVLLYLFVSSYQPGR